MTMRHRFTTAMAALAMSLATTACEAGIDSSVPDRAQAADASDGRPTPEASASGEQYASHGTCSSSGPSARDPYAPSPDRDPINQAQDLVREVYERQFQSENSSLPSAFDPSTACRYFTHDIVQWLTSSKVDAHPLYGAQDFDGAVGEPTPDPDHPMLRGMITINVDFTNFGHRQRAVFYIRPDTDKPDAPLRIFRVEHDGWSYP